MKNRRMFAEYLALFGEVFDKEITEAIRNLYWRILEPYEDEQVEKAFKAVIATKRFFPKPAELLELIEGSPDDQAQKALEKVMWAVRHIGPYSSVRFDDPKIHGAVESMGGWIEFQNCTLEEWTWRQKDFLKHYAIQSEKGQPERLAGLVEVNNRNRGFVEHLPEPLKVGQIESGRVGYIEAPKKTLRKGLELVVGRQQRGVEGNAESESMRN